MKNLILTTLILALGVSITTTTQAATPSLTCYGAVDVDQAEPFVLTLQNANEFQVGLIMEDMIADGLLSPALVFSIDGVQILSMSVNVEKIASIDWNVTNEVVNEVVEESVKLLMKKYKIRKSNYDLSCTYLAEGQPKAGGMN